MLKITLSCEAPVWLLPVSIANAFKDAGAVETHHWFQHQAVNIPDLGYVHPPSKFSIFFTLNMHPSDDIRRTKDIQWAHGRPPVWASVHPNNLGTMYSDYSLIPTR